MLGLASIAQNDPSVLPTPGTPAERPYALLDPQDRLLLEARMRSLGFDTSKLYWDR